MALSIQVNVWCKGKKNCTVLSVRRSGALIELSHVAAQWAQRRQRGTFHFYPVGLYKKYLNKQSKSTNQPPTRWPITMAKDWSFWDKKRRKNRFNGLLLSAQWSLPATLTGPQHTEWALCDMKTQSGFALKSITQKCVIPHKPNCASWLGAK